MSFTNTNSIYFKASLYYYILYIAWSLSFYVDDTVTVSLTSTVTSISHFQI